MQHLNSTSFTIGANILSAWLAVIRGNSSPMRLPLDALSVSRYCTIGRRPETGHEGLVQETDSLTSHCNRLFNKREGLSLGHVRANPALKTEVNTISLRRSANRRSVPLIISFKTRVP